MKAVVYEAPRKFAVRDVPTPEPAAGEVRIKIDQVGVCGTDLHIHNGDFQARFPLIPGHELVGCDRRARRRRRAVRGRRAGDRQPQHLLRTLRLLPVRAADPLSQHEGPGQQLPGLLRGVRHGAGEPGLLGRGARPRRRRLHRTCRLRDARARDAPDPARLQRARLRCRSDRPAAGAAHRLRRRDLGDRRRTDASSSSMRPSALGVDEVVSDRSRDRPGGQRARRCGTPRRTATGTTSSSRRPASPEIGRHLRPADPQRRAPCSSTASPEGRDLVSSTRSTSSGARSPSRAPSRR